MLVEKIFLWKNKYKKILKTNQFHVNYTLKLDKIIKKIFKYVPMFDWETQGFQTTTPNPIKGRVRFSRVF